MLKLYYLLILHTYLPQMNVTIWSAVYPHLQLFGDTIKQCPTAVVVETSSPCFSKIFLVEKKIFQHKLTRVGSHPWVTALWICKTCVIGND